MEIVITKSFTSSVLNRTIEVTPLNEEGVPMYTIGINEERGKVLIEAGVAEECISEDLEDIESSEENIEDIEEDLTEDSNKGTEEDIEPEDSGLNNTPEEENMNEQTQQKSINKKKKR